MKRLTPLQEKINQRPCPICGGTEYEWGQLSHVRYQLKVGLNYKLMMSRRCLRCENLQQFVDEARTKSDQRTVIIVLLLMVLVIALIIVGLVIINTNPSSIQWRF